MEDIVKQNEAIKLCNEHRLLLHNEDFSFWEGYLTIENNQFKVKIQTPFFPSTRNISLECPPFLKSCIHPQLPNLVKCDTVIGFINFLIHIVKSKLLSESKQVEVWDKKLIRFYQAILSELETSVGIENVLEVQEDMRTVRMTYTDRNLENHILEIMIPQDYPKSNVYLMEADLPNEVLVTFSKVNSISKVYFMFKSSVDSLIPFWNMCKSIEEKAWVIDPQKPKKKDTYRRISINDSLSVVLTFNPFEITSLPDVKFLGSLHAVTEGRELYTNNLNRYGWSSEIEVVDNLRLLLGLDKLPVKPIITNDSEDSVKVCLICYDDDPDKEVPFKLCTNDKCTSWYHFSCILKWCQSQVTSSTLYNHISGTCPFCNEKIWCPLPSSI